MTKPFVFTGLGLFLITAWSFVSQINWAGVSGCVVGYQAGNWLSSLLGG